MCGPGNPFARTARSCGFCEASFTGATIRNATGGSLCDTMHEFSQIRAQLISNATEHSKPAPAQAKECCWIFKAVMQSLCRAEDAHLGACDLDAHAVGSITDRECA